jgi:hypothetical protein
MNILEVPAPLFAWIDGLLQGLPAPMRLLLWGIAAAVLSMWLYRQFSPQQRIAQGRREQSRARARLDAFDGELTAAWPLIRDLLRASLVQVARVTGPAVLASLPLLFLLVWLSAAYGHAFPAGAVAQGPDGTLTGGEYLAFAPTWMRGWGFTFFAVLIVASLIIKRIWRIE